MKKAKCFSDIHYDIGKIDDKMYSSFTEHLGRSIYTGIYEPGHPNADEDGYRKDVMELVKELGVPVIRYPGGNFVSCYDWHDGIGPKEKRPKRMDYAWSSIETNQFGIDEFCQWAEKVGIEPMIAVNLGTGSIKDAGDLVEYCNHPGGTYWSDLRAQNGHPEPYNIKYWCLGNEMEGSWQAGHLSAEDYTKKALEAAKIMRWVDPSIKLVACGSSYEMLPTYMEWDRTMLTDLYNQVDYLSTHNYTMNSGQGTTNYLASYKQLDSHIKNSAKVIEYVKAKNHFDKDLKICLDEWNVWNFQDIKLDSLDDLMGLTTFEMTSAGKWEIAPPILQEKYSLLDAVVVGGLGISLLNNADTVEIACLAQLINVIAPITTINVMAKRLQENIVEMVEQEKREQQLKYGLMISQVDPHFIYNTMNMITYLAQKNRNEDVIAVNKAMIQILRDRLRIEVDNVYDTVEQEIKVVREYLLIQKYRYTGIFKSVIDIEAGVEPYLIAKNILQPLVENAFFHGILCNTDEEGEVIDGCITIRIRMEEDEVEIIVKDNGAGMSQDKLDELSKPQRKLSSMERGEHIGIKNIKERLDYIYENKYRFQIWSKEGEGTIVTIRIPAIVSSETEK